MKRKFEEGMAEKKGVELFNVLKSMLKRIGYEVESVGASPFSLNPNAERLVCTFCNAGDGLLDFDSAKIIEETKEEIAHILSFESEDIEINVDNMLGGQISWLGHIVISLVK